MTLKFILICAGSWTLVSCDPSVSTSDDADGIYVLEYATEITNPNTGDKVGMRKIRDTIMVEKLEDEYKISNRKWQMNDYDQEGWTSMEHADDRPMPTYIASYDATASALESKDANVQQTIFLDDKNEKIFKDKSMDRGYLKIK